MSSNLFKYVVNRHYDASNNTSALQHLTKGSESMIQRMSLMQLLDNHRGCVNTIVWSDDGNFLLSGSDDQHLVISDPWQGCQLKRIHTAHRANIFSAKFLPHKCNKQIVSCSGDGVLCFTDLEKEYETYDCKFLCHMNTCYDVLTIPDDPHSFLSCGEDGTVRWFDLRLKEKCSRSCQEDVLLNVGKAVTAIAVNPVTPYHLAIAAQDSTVRIYDRRMLGTSAHDSYNTESDGALLMRLRPDSLEGKNHRVTSLRYSPTGQEVLASFSSDYLYLFDTQNFKQTEMEGATGSEKDEGGSSGPTLKRLRLRGDWSDTGPQALPESETRNQAGDVSQARPTLHATLMQRMTDVLSRMLNDPGTRAAVHRTVSESREEERRERSEAMEHEEHSVQEPESVQDNSEPESSQSEGNVPSTGSQCNTDVPAQGAVDSPEETQTSSASVSRADTALAVQACTLEEANGSRPAQEEEPKEVDNVGLAQSQVVKSEAQRSGFPARDHSPEQELLHSNIHTLEDRLSSMRQGFIDRHRVEPAVSLSYSGRGVTSGVISLGVGDEVTRQPYSEEEDVPAAAIDFEETSQMSAEESQPMPSVSPTTSQSHVSSSASGEDAAHEAAVTVAGASGAAVASASGGSEEPILGLEEAGEAVRLHFDEGLDLHSGSSVGQVHRSASQSLPLSRLASQPDEENLRIGHEDEIDSDEEASSNSTRSASARMAIAIDRALRRSRDENAGPNVGGPRESFAPLGSVKQCYKGHRNARTMIKEATFWGKDHVMSGSDCGRIFVWNLHTGRLVMLWEADRHVVNCVQPHPLLPVLATSGIDYDVKLWAPLHEEPHFDEDKAAEIMRRNEVLLEETRDTITVPASFMIRMLASLNQIRRGRWRSRSQASDTEEREQ